MHQANTHTSIFRLHPSLTALTVSSQAGTAVGDTAISVTPSKSASNAYKYKIADREQLVHLNDDVSAWTTWDGDDDITAATGSVITLVEADSTSKAKKVGVATVVAKEG